jgi:hypothetical protein
MAKQIGSQYRETLEEAGYTIVERKGNQILLKEVDGNKVDLFIKNDHHSGWTVEINDIGYEFVHTAGHVVYQMGKFLFIEPA